MPRSETYADKGVLAQEGPDTHDNGFSYNPASFWIGLAISLVALLAALALAARSKVFRA